jgi:hypothetical protein
MAEVGYASTGAVSAAISELLKQIPAEAVEQMRDRENQKLDEIEKRYNDILRREHVIVNQGRIMGKWVGWRRDPDTGEVLRNDKDEPIAVYEDLRDSGPEMTALQGLIRCQERRAKLNGLDRPFKIQLEDTDMDAEIEALMAELAVAPTEIPVDHPG